jgi:nicotinamide phosphoribosyltransferase
MLMHNRLFLTDSYKVSHAPQYPPGTRRVDSYFESRGGEYDDVVFFGLRYLLMRYLAQPITISEIDEAERLYYDHLGPDIFNRAGWLNILERYDGRLPVAIRAVPEGTVVPTHNVLMTIHNTDEDAPNPSYWLTNWLETLLVQVWYPSTVATISREIKKVLRAALLRSAESLDGLDHMLHDFGCRGSTSMESAAIGGAAHLVNFRGTDTVPAVALLRRYYGAECAGVSIPASEHSTITSWGRDHEVDAYRNMLQRYPKGLVACVSDSWDIYRAVRELWGRELRANVMARDGKLIVRPDSGEPTVVLPRVLDSAGNAFGQSMNGKGYRMLDPHVGFIQGDGIKRHTVGPILDAVMDAGWSAANLAFGSGGGLLQDCDRDTQNFAFKCNSIRVGDELRDVYKDPVEASWKASKRGRLALVRDADQHYQTVAGPSMFDELRTVYRDGEVLTTDSFDDIRSRAAL